MREDLVWLIELPPLTAFPSLSILAQPMDAILRYTHHPISSRIFDVLIESPTVSFKSKRNTLLTFTNATKWFELVDDRIGSRVGERLWEGCDGFLKEKIAKTLIPFEQALSQSQFGRFFGRKVNLNLYRRKPDEWRKSQIPPPPPPPSQGPAAPASVAAAGAREEAPDANAPKKRKRAAERAEQPQDEIDLLFAAAPPAVNSSHSAPAALRPTAAVTEEVDEKKKRKKDKTAALESELGDVLGAIKASTGKKEKKVKKQSKEGGEDGEGERKEKKKRRKEKAEA